MKFRRVLFTPTHDKSRKYIYLDELNVKEQREYLKEYPELEKFVIYEDDKQGSTDNIEVQPKQKPSKRRKRKPSPDKSE